MPADRSFDRILFWLIKIKFRHFKIHIFCFRRTVENNTFQLFEYSMSRNLLHNALQIQFGIATNVLPNVFIVELPELQQIYIMLATHIGIYRWILKHPTLNGIGQLVRTFVLKIKKNLILYFSFLKGTISINSC